MPNIYMRVFLSDAADAVQVCVCPEGPFVRGLIWGRKVHYRDMTKLEELFRLFCRA